jgi:cation diffusion facilitator family transporter
MPPWDEGKQKGTMSSEHGHDARTGHVHAADPEARSGQREDAAMHEQDDRDAVGPGDDHQHAMEHHHDHAHGGGWRRWGHRLGHLLTPHSHDTADKIDSVMESSHEGIRALWISLLGLGATALLQLLVYLWSGSVALLGDTLHNLADALTAIPLGVAFLIGRRAATRRYTYGFGRAEDLAGIAIVLVIAASSAGAGYEAVRRLLQPAAVGHLWAVAVAAIIGFAGNEIVARYRITVGRRIGSAALVADGLHARTDGFTSLAVLLGAGGVGIGWHWADPVVGLGITVAILFVLKDAAREVYRRLMDAVDPALVDTVETTLRATPGVGDVGAVRLRWIGHQLRAECEISVPAGLTVAQGHDIAVDAEHRLIHSVPRLAAATVHADPQQGPGGPHRDPHAILASHR